jgi:hypothetical protein
VIFAARRPGWNGGTAAEIAGSGGGRYCRTAVVLRSEILAILTGQALVLRLSFQGSGVSLA